MICQRDNSGYFTLTTTDVVIESLKRSGLLPPRARPLSPGTIGRSGRFRPLKNGRSPGFTRNSRNSARDPSLSSGGRWRGRPFVPEVIRQLIRGETAVGARLLR